MVASGSCTKDLPCGQWPFCCCWIDDGHDERFWKFYQESFMASNGILFRFGASLAFSSHGRLHFQLIETPTDPTLQHHMVELHTHIRLLDFITNLYEWRASRDSIIKDCSGGDNRATFGVPCRVVVPFSADRHVDQICDEASSMIAPVNLLVVAILASP